MKRLLLITTIAILKTSTIFACCAENDYRLFPVGQIKSSVLFIEFKLSRNCRIGDGAGANNEFWTRGTVNLVSDRGDSLILIQAVDTVDIKECTCTYKDFYQKTEYESKLAISYKKALKMAQQISGFQAARLTDLVFNDTLNKKIIDETADSSYSYTLKYKDLFTIDLAEEIISCYPNQIAEVRTYETDSFRITILRLRCRPLDKEAIAYNKKRFRKTGTALWKEQAQWHGITKDYWIIKNNRR